jgi:hypothetical protein
MYIFLSQTFHFLNAGSGRPGRIGVRFYFVKRFDADSRFINAHK